jgi:cyclopropane fatty-acyl-phospholipid synthase-like methyltransferase
LSADGLEECACNAIEQAFRVARPPRALAHEQEPFAVTDWGLRHVSIRPDNTILDIGCGGGRTVARLAEECTAGKVYGVDYSETSVTASCKTNSAAIAHGGVEVRHGSVSQLPFPEGMFDLITAVETHFWWPDLPGDVREVFASASPAVR